MADEGEEEEEGGGGGGDGGSGLKKYGPLAAIVLVAQVVLAWVVISLVLKDNVPESEEDPQDLIDEQRVELRSGQEEEKFRLPFYYSPELLGNITANPAGTNSERFVVITVQLGLEAYNRDESPPDDDITEKLAEDTTTLEKIGRYDRRIVSVINRIIRLKTVDELEGEFIHEIEDEIRDKLNKDIFERLFRVDDENKEEVIVAEVDISNLIIQ